MVHRASGSHAACLSASTESAERAWKTIQVWSGVSAVQLKSTPWCTRTRSSINGHDVPLLQA